MKKIVVLTATRAEYGLLKPLILKLRRDGDFDLRVAVTGMHLSSEYGMTVREIEGDGISVDRKIQILLGSDTPVAISKSMGLATISFAEYFDQCRPDALLVLGDRYETLAVCCAALNARIPILHLHGGESTEGMIDEAVRHSITKMSFLHFTSTEAYRRRVIQMGEAPERVFNVGALGVENALGTELMSLSELEALVGGNLGPVYAVGTFHPVTLEEDTAGVQTEELLAALDDFEGIHFLFTKANADAGGKIINELLSRHAAVNPRYIFVDSLGTRGYLTALKHAAFVIGNSSSGLIEAPSFGIPTVDIGDRQKGRMAGETVIHCLPDRDSIRKAVQKALWSEFRTRAAQAQNPYGDGRTSDRVVKRIKEFFEMNKVDIKKKFHDIEF